MIQKGATERDRNAYYDVLIQFQAWCEQSGRSFPLEMVKLIQGRMNEADETAGGEDRSETAAPLSIRELMQLRRRRSATEGDSHDGAISKPDGYPPASDN